MEIAAAIPQQILLTRKPAATGSASAKRSVSATEDWGPVPAVSTPGFAAKWGCSW